MMWGIALLVLSLPAAPPNPLAEASAHLDAGRYEQAIAILKDLAEKEPGEVVYQFNLALAYSLAGQEELAIAGYRKTLQIKEDLFEARLNLGQTLLRTGRAEEAASWLDKAAAQKPSDSKPVYLLGRALAAQKKWTEAAAAFEKALALDPQNSSLPLEIAEAWEQAGQPAKAAEFYRKLPNDPAARERLGLILINLGDLAGAIEQLEAVRQSSPTPAALYALATAYLRNKQPDKSLPLAEELIRLEPARADLRLFFGRLLRDQKRYADAAKEFYQATRLTPANLEAWNELAGMLLLLEKFDGALEALERSKQLGGETPAYHYFRATTLDALKQAEPALASYQKFLAASGGKFPDEEFKARQRIKVLERVLRK
ncbi:MAG: tetratricopeptide repeat protein [Bryobacteraceae bacterium]|nr:tetratricopeptide repeat protein [Bryobacteraceae bacterium]